MSKENQAQTKPTMIKIPSKATTGSGVGWVGADGVHDAGAIGELLAGLLAAPTTLATFVGCTV